MSSTSTPSSASNRKWIVRKLVSHRFKAEDKMEFLVQWEGFNRRFDSWEPFENVQPATLRLHQYYQVIGEEEVNKIKTCRLMMKRSARAKREVEGETSSTKEKKRKDESEGDETPRGAPRKSRLGCSSERGKGSSHKEREASTSSTSTRAVETPTRATKFKEADDKKADGTSTPTSGIPARTKLDKSGSTSSVTTPAKTKTVKAENSEDAVEREVEKKKRGGHSMKIVKQKEPRIGESREREKTKEERSDEDKNDADVDMKNEGDEEIQKTMKKRKTKDGSTVSAIPDLRETPISTSAEIKRPEEANELKETEIGDRALDSVALTSVVCLAKKGKYVIPVEDIQCEWTTAYRLKTDLPLIDENENPRVPVIGMEIDTVLSEDEEEIIVLRSSEMECQRPPLLERRTRDKKYSRHRKATRPEKIIPESGNSSKTHVKKRGKRNKKKTGLPIVPLIGTSTINETSKVGAEETMKKISKVEQLMMELTEKKRKEEEKTEESRKGKEDEELAEKIMDEKIADDSVASSYKKEREDSRESSEEIVLPLVFDPEQEGPSNRHTDFPQPSPPSTFIQSTASNEQISTNKIIAEEEPIVEMKEELTSDGEYEVHVERRTSRTVKKRKMFSPSR